PYCRCSPGLNDRDLRRTLAQIPERPGIVRVDLMIDANHLVPGLTMLHRREVQLRARWKVESPVGAFGDPFQTAEEMEFVSHDRPAERAAPLFQRALGFWLIVQPGEIILRRKSRIGEVSKHDAPELIRALLGDRVDNRAARPAELRVVLIRQDL